MSRLMNPTRYALGLTSGSIRAIVALVIVIAAVAAALHSIERSELPASAAALLMLAQAVVRDYFDVSRKTSDGNGAGSNEA